MSNKKYLVVYKERGQEYGLTHSVVDEASEEEAVKHVREEIDESYRVVVYELGKSTEFRFKRVLERAGEVTPPVGANDYFKRA